MQKHVSWIVALVVGFAVGFVTAGALLLVGAALTFLIKPPTKPAAAG